MSGRMEELDHQITALQGTVSQLQGDLQTAQATMDGLVMERASLRTGVNVGDIVISGGQQFRVTRLRDWGNSSPPWLWGNPIKKDGSVGVAVRAIYGQWKPIGSIRDAVLSKSRGETPEPTDE